MNQISTTKPALKYGIFTGIASIVYGFLMQVLHLEENFFLGMLGIVILISGMVFAMKEYKRFNEDYMSFGQGLSIGLIVSVLSGIMSSFYMLIYYSIDPSKLEAEKAKGIIQLENQGYSDAQIEQTMNLMNFMFKPSILFVLGIIGALIFGLFLSLIVSAIMQKKRPMFE
jgi:membrane-bound ClpP family serine protease